MSDSSEQDSSTDHSTSGTDENSDSESAGSNSDSEDYSESESGSGSDSDSSTKDNSDGLRVSIDLNADGSVKSTRVYNARSGQRNNVQVKVNDSIQQARQRAAAVKIQRLFRGYSTRKRYRELLMPLISKRKLLQQQQQNGKRAINVFTDHRLPLKRRIRFAIEELLRHCSDDEDEELDARKWSSVNATRQNPRMDPTVQRLLHDSVDDSAMDSITSRLDKLIERSVHQRWATN